MTARVGGMRQSKFGTMNGASWILPIAILAIVAVMAVVEPRFFNRLNIYNILREFTVTALLALAQGLVMIAGGFDLSIGTIMAAASVIAALTMLSVAEPFAGYPMLIISTGFVCALLVGTGAGMVNGALVSRLKASPFIVTLGTMTVISGLTYWYTKGTPVYGMPDALVSQLGRGRFLGVPVIFWVGLAIIAILWWIATQTRFGRHLYAVGSNPAAAHESGINPARVLVIVYGMSGFLAATAGLILTARLGSGQSGIGGSAAIESIAAAVIGGVALRGGIGSIPRIVIAALFLVLFSNALNLAQIDSKYQTLVLGLFLIAFVASERRFDRNG